MEALDAGHWDLVVSLILSDFSAKSSNFNQFLNYQ